MLHFFIVSFKKLLEIFLKLGIPYAEKPINDLRFKRPLPVSNWTDVLQTISEPFSCYQKGNLSSSEDCLYLNIWAPSGNIANLPVLIWF